MQIDKREIKKNRILGNWIYYLNNGGGIHGKIKNWKDGDPEREPAFAHVFRQEVEKGMILFDIGANLGYYSFVAAQIMESDGRIFAFEPDPRNAALLRKGVRRNEYENIIEASVLAVSNRPRKTADFHLSHATNLSSMEKTEHTDKVVNVQTTTLSKFAWDKRIVDGNVFIRMDIEGHEVEALEGAITFLKKGFPCKIFMEVHPQFYSEEHSLEKILVRILKLDFTTKYVISAAVSKPDKFLRLGYTPTMVFDCGRFERGLYDNVIDKDMLELACHEHRQEFSPEMVRKSGEWFTDKIVRSVLLERK